MARVKKTHCLRGHPRTPENVDAGRHCRVCKCDWQRERYATNSEYRERSRESNRERFRERYATDPAFHEAHLARFRERYATDVMFAIHVDARRRHNRISERAARPQRPSLEQQIVNEMRKEGLWPTTP